MTAPGLPNLKELLGTGRGRGRGGRSRGRGRGTGIGTGAGSAADMSRNDTQTQDHVIQKTDEDAAGSRLSAVNVGYLTDEYASYFYSGVEQPRRFPIINRGTYMRTTAIDRLVNQFLVTDDETPKQIISLGAGTDTRFFRLITESLARHVVYHEFDFARNTARKIQGIKDHPVLLQSITKHLTNVDDLLFGGNGSSLQSPVFNIHPVDLRTISSSSLSMLQSVSPSMATLLLSECCLIYLSPEDNDRILNAFMEYLSPSSTPVGIVIYEPIRPNDAFGRTMVSNLAARGIHMQTLQRYESLAAQRARLKHAGFETLQCAADVQFIYNEWTSAQDKKFVSSREMMDELEEWTLLAKHYCVAWGACDGNSTIFTKAWSELASQRED